MNCDCDYEQSTVWSAAKHRARKPYKCSECNGTISKGEIYTRIASLFDGRWDTFRQCEDCRVVICDLGQATKSDGGCFCYAARNLTGDMMEMAVYANSDDLRILEPIFASFNAASKHRGGRQLDMDIFKRNQ